MGGIVLFASSTAIRSLTSPSLPPFLPPSQNRLDFYLDPDSTQYRSILEMAEGFWFIDDRPADRPKGWTRVYMSATVKVNNLVPMWLVEYAAERALKRATSWLKPYVEQNRGGGERREEM